MWSGRRKAWPLVFTPLVDRNSIVLSISIVFHIKKFSTQPVLKLFKFHEKVFVRNLHTLSYRRNTCTLHFEFVTFVTAYRRITTFPPKLDILIEDEN